jgi:hypothetical protein
MAMTMYNEEKRRPSEQQRGGDMSMTSETGMKRIRTLYSVNSGSFAAVCLALLLYRVAQFRIYNRTRIDYYYAYLKHKYKGGRLDSSYNKAAI